MFFFSVALLSQQVNPIRFIYVTDSTHIVILWSPLLPPIPHIFITPSHHEPISVFQQHLPKRYPFFSCAPDMITSFSSMQSDLYKYVCSFHSFKLMDEIFLPILHHASETVPSPILKTTLSCCSYCLLHKPLSFLP